MTINREWQRYFCSFVLFLLWNCSVVGQSLPDAVKIDYASLNKPLSIVLKELSQKSGVSINFSEDRIPADKKISISVQDEKVGDILSVILKDIGYDYEIIGNQLVIIKDSSRGLEKSLTISGYVRDKVSGENLIYANVYLYDKSKGTQTNDEGFYSLTLPRGTQRVYVSYIGYKQAVREYYLAKDVEEDFLLAPDVQLNEVIILEEVENREEETTASEDNLYLDQIQTASTLGGESDIIRLINMMPGVSSGADGLGGMNIRGGSNDQNLVLLDGAPVYNSGHALGLFSVFNSDVIKNAKLYKGNIPARYGGRLSSVLDVRTRDGNKNKVTGGLSLSTLALKGYIEGPIGKGGSSYLISGRRTFLDPWVKSLTEYINDLSDKDGFSTYFFADLNAKINLQFNKKNSLLISAFAARDDFDNNLSEDKFAEGISTLDKSGVRWNWGNNTLSTRFKRQMSNKAFSTLSAYYTDFSFQSFDYDSFTSTAPIDSTFIYKAGLFQSAINDVNVSYAIDYVPNTEHRIRAGAGFTKHTFNPSLSSVSTNSGLFQLGDDIREEVIEAVTVKPEITGTEWTAYLEDDISFSYGTKLNIGVHGNFIKTETNSYLDIQPRIALLTQANNLYFKIGASKMNQYLHLLSSNGLGLPSDVWLPSTDKLAPEESWIFSADVGFKNKQGFQWGVETYYKVMQNITSFNEGGTVDIVAGSNWEESIPVGSGNSYGAELYLNKIIGRTTWNANYTLSFSNQEFLDLNLGEVFPFRYDRRHNVKLGFFHKITDNTEFVLNWNYSTGNPITYPSDVLVDVNGVISPIYLEKNNRRLPVYHRLDFAFNFYSKLRWARQKFSLGLYNAFNRQNKFFIDITRNPGTAGAFEQSSFSILPVFPAITYSLSFN